MKVSDYNEKTSFQYDDLILVVNERLGTTQTVQVKDFLSGYTGWSYITMTNTGQDRYSSTTEISGGITRIPTWHFGNSTTPGIYFVERSGNSDYAYIGCIDNHNGLATPGATEFVITSRQSMAFAPGQDGNKDAFVQMGRSGPLKERWYLQYDTEPNDNTDSDGITSWPYGHSKRLGFISKSSGGGTVNYAFPGIIGINTTTGSDVYSSDTYHEYNIRGELWFYTRLPEYPFTSYPGTMMGKMMNNGWNLRGKQLREKINTSTNTLTIDFNSSQCQTFEVGANSVTVTGSNFLSSSTDFQEVHVLIKSGPFVPTMTFPNWSWGNQTGIASAPTGITSGQALILHLKAFDTGTSGVFATYSVHNLPFSYDVDAQSFFTAAAITSATDKLALHQLVTNAKSHGWWSKCDVIYPMCGGTSGSHSYNLKNTGLYRITWNGSVGHGAGGITGNGTNAWGDTNFNLSGNGVQYQLNSGHLFAYCGTTSPTTSHMISCASFSPLTTTTCRAAVIVNSSFISYAGNNNAVGGGNISNPAGFSGAFASIRVNSTDNYMGYKGNYSLFDTSTAVGVPPVTVGLMARKYYDTSAGVDNFFSGNLRGATIGASLSSSEWTNFRNDWDTFQSALGR